MTPGRFRLYVIVFFIQKLFNKQQRYEYGGSDKFQKWQMPELTAAVVE